ncbi:MAG TPA: hypothetical protein VNA25_24645 [Phycisphaerae bacterium]|nr:hypothetical protein [Phycisphaerae bacterium]
MTGNGQYVSADIPLAAAHVEDELARSLSRTSRQVAQAECFDDEQRAEVYTILQALRADTNAHQELLGTWVSDNRPCCEGAV